MLPALFLPLAALAFTLFRLWACRAQLLDMARTLEETPAESSLRLTVRLESSAVRRLCCAVNRRLDEGRDLRLETLRGEQELRYTMACISHDIRPPPWPGPWAISSFWRPSRSTGSTWASS